MSDTPIFHVGILVADLDAAIKRFTSLFNLSFPEARVLPVTFEPADGSGEPVEVAARATFSREGPPHIELIQAGGNGQFSLERGEGLHHLGVWGPSWDEYEKLEPSRCLPIVTKIHQTTGGPQMWVSDPAALCGTAIEIVDENMRPVFERLITGA